MSEHDGARARRRSSRTAFPWRVPTERRVSRSNEPCRQALRGPMRSSARARDPARAHPQPVACRGAQAFPPHTTATTPRSRGALPRSWCSQVTSLHSSRLQELGELLARIEHAGLYRSLRDADDLSHLFHRLLVVVDEIDDLAMFHGQRLQALAQHREIIDL